MDVGDAFLFDICFEGLGLAENSLLDGLSVSGLGNLFEVTGLGLNGDSGSMVKVFLQI